MIPDTLRQAIEHAHYMGESIPQVVAEYESQNHPMDQMTFRDVQAFIKTLPPVCRSCSL